MLKLCLVVLVFLYSAVSSAHTSNSTTEIDKILAKFYQTDYKLTFEWAAVERINSKYGDLKLNTFKFNRTCTAINVTFFSIVDMGNEVEIVVQAYKMASNEYRLFPMRIQVNFCHGLVKNVMGAGSVHQCGNFSCPVHKGMHYRYCNWTPDESQLPPFVPSGKYMFEFQGFFRSEEIFLTKNYVKISRFFD